MSGDRDDFWKIEYIVPTRDRRRFSADTEAVEIELDGHSEGARKSTGDIRIQHGRGPAKLPDEEYTPACRLIKKVTVTGGFEQENTSFAVNAKRCLARPAVSCEREAFTSFMPTHPQLNMRQRAWYLWWRSRMRGGEPLDTDFSYILLFIYEIINIPELYPPELGLELLCAVWRAYREKYTKLDGYLTEWLCDYCLLNRLSLPSEALGQEILDSAVRLAQLREFYLNCGDDASLIGPLCRYFSNYSPKRGKFYNKNTEKLFKTHIPATFGRLFDTLGGLNGWCDGETPLTETSTSRMTYVGAFCPTNRKRYLKLDYIMLSRGPALRSLVTNVMKYAENHVRTLAGVNAKYKVDGLPPKAAACIDGYFAPLEAELTRKSAEESAPEYDTLYEPENGGLSVDRAFGIEIESWKNAEALTVDGEEAEERTVSEQAASESPTVAEPEKAADEASGDRGLVVRALRRLLEGDCEGFEREAARANLLPDALVRLINDTLYDELGDIAVEELDGRPAPVEDYLDDLREIVK